MFLVALIGLGLYSKYRGRVWVSNCQWGNRRTGERTTCQESQRCARVVHLPTLHFENTRDNRPASCAWCCIPLFVSSLSLSLFHVPERLAGSRRKIPKRNRPHCTMISLMSINCRIVRRSHLEGLKHHCCHLLSLRSLVQWRLHHQHLLTEGYW